MRAYQVWYSDALAWSDICPSAGGLYTSPGEANKEILDQNFVWDELTNRFVDFYGEEFATIEEVEILEKYVKRGGVNETDG